MEKLNKRQLIDRPPGRNKVIFTERWLLVEVELYFFDCTLKDTLAAKKYERFVKNTL